jgi:hypothetical protein
MTTTRMLRWAAYAAVVALGAFVPWALGVHRLQHLIFLWLIVLVVTTVSEPAWRRVAQRFANRSAKPS